jgi:hypothetical protein
MFEGEEKYTIGALVKLKTVKRIFTPPTQNAVGIILQMQRSQVCAGYPKYYVSFPTIDLLQWFWPHQIVLIETDKKT